MEHLHGWIPASTAALVGLLTAVPLRAALARHRYRHAEEQPLPDRSHCWLLVALPMAGFALAARWSWAWPPPGAPRGPVPSAIAGSVVAVAYCATLPLLAALAAIDLDVHRLPDRLTGALTVVSAAAVALASAAAGDGAALGRAALAAIGLGAAYLLVRALSPGRSGIGFGDVKLAPALGLLLGWVSWSAVVTGTLVAFVGGGVWAGLLLLTRRARGSDRLAFGPFMIFGALVAILVEGR